MLEKGAIVITDRYTLSTFIYQSKVGGVRAIDIYKLNDFATDRVSPDLTFILDINAETAIKRIQDNVREQNYIDKKSLDFHMKIDEEYRNYFGVGIRHIDANRDLSDIGEDILKHISYYVKVKAMPYEVKNDTTKTDL